MTFYIGRVGIKLHFLFFIVLSYMLSFESGKYYITALFYACIHECAHIAVLTRLYDGSFRVTVGMFGMRLDYDDTVRFTLKNEALTAFSGPCANLILTAVFYILTIINPDSRFFIASLIINASLAFFNMLPVVPLDGGNFLYNIILMKSSVQRADTVLNITGICTLVLFAVILIVFKSAIIGTIAFFYIAFSFLLRLLKK